jgi:hypothetical protein
VKESAIIKAVMDYVRKLRLAGVPIKVIKFHGNQYVEVGTPDLIGSIGSRAINIEAKVPGEEPTKIQQQRLMEWKNAGSITGVIHGVRDFRRIIEEALGSELPEV